MAVFRLLRSYSLTTISPRELEAPVDDAELSWLTRAAVCVSMAADTSGGSSTAGSGTGSDSCVRELLYDVAEVGVYNDGRIDGKYL